MKKVARDRKENLTHGVWRQEGTTPSVSIKKNIFRRNATLTARLFFFFKVRAGFFFSSVCASACFICAGYC